MLNRRPPPDRPVEYPYESLYRPLSWVLASFGNLFLFATLGAIIFVFYKRWKASRRKRTVSYRKVEVNKTDRGLPGRGFAGRTVGQQGGLALIISRPGQPIHAAAGMI